MKLKLLCLSNLAVASLQAHALGSLADITIVERASGQTLPVYHHRGGYWVTGSPGATYSISVRNKSGQRLLAAPSVDGANVLSGQTAAWEQSRHVLGTCQSYQITGKSDSEVATF